jgi:hypothetical protein
LLWEERQERGRNRGENRRVREKRALRWKKLKVGERKKQNLVKVCKKQMINELIRLVRETLTIQTLVVRVSSLSEEII